jgi:hypothetical protein
MQVKLEKTQKRPISHLHGRQAAAKEREGGVGGEGREAGREGETESSKGERGRESERERERESERESEGEERPALAPSSSKGAEMAPCSLQKAVGKEEPGTTRGIVANANVLPYRPAHHILVVRVDIV